MSSDLHSKTKQPKNMNLSAMIKIALLVAIGVILKLYETPPLFAGFLKLDFGDVPAAIGAISLGPWAAVIIELLKEIIKVIIKNDTGGIGELASFTVSITYMIPLGVICGNKKTIPRFITGAAVGTVCMVIAGSVLNYFFFLPMYAAFYGTPIDTIIGMGTKFNASITDMKTLIMFAVAPFNLFKAVIISIVGYFLYRLLRRAL